MPLAEQKLTGLKKRQQIEHANRIMFIWVAAASVAISFFLVSAQFLYEKWSYNNRVIAVKTKASDTLTQNVKNAQKLQENVNALVGNQDLASLKTAPDDANAKIILDALPSTFDSTALATSLQLAILNRSGVVIESITVPGQTVRTSSSTDTASAADQAKPQEMKFSIVATGSYDRIRGMIVDLQRTIRPMKLTTINLSGSDNAMRATIEGVTYYQPAKTLNIRQETVR